MSKASVLGFHQITHHTRVLATQQEEYRDLYIRDETMDDGENIMVSEWKPDADQLAILQAGGSIFLGILGEVHPPVLILAGPETTYEGSGDDTG